MGARPAHREEPGGPESAGGGGRRTTHSGTGWFKERGPHVAEP